MSPATGLSPLRVGPEDLEQSEGGELVKDLGIAGNAKHLIQATHRAMPDALRVAAGRHEHTQRTRFLNEDEVRGQAEAIVGEELLDRVLSARVRGRKEMPLESNVVILYLTKKNRTGRCYAAYKLFPKSIQAFDSALEEGTAVVATTENPKALAAENERLQEELKRLQTEGRVNAEGGVTEDDGQGAAEKAAAAKAEVNSGSGDKLTAVPEGAKAKDIVAGVGDYSDDLLAELAKDDRSTVAKAAKAEQKSRKD